MNPTETHPFDETTAFERLEQIRRLATAPATDMHPPWELSSLELERELVRRSTVRGATEIARLMHVVELIADKQCRRHAALGDLDRRIREERMKAEL
jgi:hypothetical protein